MPAPRVSALGADPTVLQTCGGRAGLAAPCGRESPAGQPRAVNARLLDPLAVLRRFASAAAEREPLFGSLDRFLQAELGTGQVRLGLRPGNLAAHDSHYAAGSPVGRSRGLDAAPAL